MSSLYYGSVTAKRDLAPKGQSTKDSPPRMKTYVDAAAALVPAEVLALSGAITGIASTATVSGNDDRITLTDAATLKVTFIVLTVAAPLLYLIGKLTAGKFAFEDLLRAPIPAAAFWAWAMLQKGTGFDVLFPNFHQVPRAATAILLAAGLGTLAAYLGYRADQTDPK